MAKPGSQCMVFFGSGSSGDPNAGYGRSTHNPVKLSSVAGGYLYLDRLAPEDGGEFLYARCNTYRQDNGHTIDCYKITREGSLNDAGFLLYIDGYAGCDLNEAPTGCILRDHLSTEGKMLEQRIKKMAKEQAKAFGTQKTGCLIPFVLMFAILILGGYFLA